MGSRRVTFFTPPGPDNVTAKHCNGPLLLAGIPITQPVPCPRGESLPLSIPFHIPPQVPILGTHYPLSVFFTAQGFSSLFHYPHQCGVNASPNKRLLLSSHRRLHNYHQPSPLPSPPSLRITSKPFHHRKQYHHLHSFNYNHSCRFYTIIDDFRTFIFPTGNQRIFRL